jgi:hypothetical protein
MAGTAHIDLELMADGVAPRVSMRGSFRESGTMDVSGFFVLAGFVKASPNLHPNRSRFTDCCTPCAQSSQVEPVGFQTPSKAT